jgi:hypothetical protein
VPIPALGVVDDLITVSESGYKSAKMNSFINAKTAIKKLQFGPDKCHVIHVGRNQEAYKNVDHYVEGWKMQEVQDIFTGEPHIEEAYDGEHGMTAEGVQKYLGQMISSDSTNTKNIEILRNKGIGLQNKIVQILSAISAGKFHFEMAIILRNSLLISSILSSSETWYGLTLAEIVRLEQVDEMLWLNILECSSSVPRNLIYLELGILRIRDIIKTRRFMFLHHILKQNESSLLYRFFIAQVKYPTYKDWTCQILEDMEELNIDLEFQDISDMSKERFKNIISEKIRTHAFNELLVKKLSRKSEHARGRNIK